jgi:hypothetical protein
MRLGVFDCADSTYKGLPEAGSWVGGIAVQYVCRRALVGGKAVVALLRIVKYSRPYNRSWSGRGARLELGDLITRWRPAFFNGVR